MRDFGAPSPNGMPSSNLSTQGSGINTEEEMKRKDCESQRIKKSAVRLCLLETLEATLIKSYQHSFLHDLKKDGSNRYANVEGRKLMMS